MRERLIELIMNAVGGCARYWAEVISDHLLASGVIVPPCKVGDTVFEIVDMLNSHKAFEKVVWSDTVVKIGVTTRGILHGKGIDFSEFGKTVFLTREEAEKALKERGGG